MLILISGLKTHRLELGLFLVLGYKGLTVTRELSLEVEDDVLGLLHVEADDNTTRDFLVLIGRDIKRQVVDDVTDMSEAYDEAEGDWIKVGGFGDPDFLTPKEILEATR